MSTCIFILINWVQLPKLQRTTKLAMWELVEANDGAGHFDEVMKTKDGGSKV